MPLVVLPATQRDAERIFTLTHTILGARFENIPLKERIEQEISAPTGRSAYYILRQEDDQGYVFLRRSEACPGWIELVRLVTTGETSFSDIEILFWRAQTYFKDDFLNATGTLPVGIFLQTQKRTIDQCIFYERLGLSLYQRLDTRETWIKRY